ANSGRLHRTDLRATQVRKDAAPEPHLHLLTGQLVDIEVSKPARGERMDGDGARLGIDIGAANEVDLLLRLPRLGGLELAVRERLGLFLAIRGQPADPIPRPDAVPIRLDPDLLLRPVGVGHVLEPAIFDVCHGRALLRVEWSNWSGGLLVEPATHLSRV